jgi:septal ring factor EnvC (AmiA/AmiB activator)
MEEIADARAELRVELAEARAELAEARANMAAASAALAAALPVPAVPPMDGPSSTTSPTAMRMNPSASCSAATRPLCSRRSRAYNGTPIGVRLRQRRRKLLAM